MQHLNTPPHKLRREFVDLIQSRSADSELLGRIHPEILKLCYEQHWFHLFVPEEYGGLNMELPEGLRLEEEIARADGSLGWTITLCSGASWFIGFFNKDAADTIFNQPLACIAGSGETGGVAKVVDDGYQISGKWRYATGAAHATVFTANCFLEHADGSPVLDHDGSRVIRPFWFRREEVNIQESWKTLGMVATASHGFTIDSVDVSTDSCFEISSLKASLSQPIYKFPFLQFAEATIAVNSSGMALHFLDCCEELIHKNGSEAAMYQLLQQETSIAKLTLESIRSRFYEVIENSWNELLTRGCISEDRLLEVSQISRALALNSRKLVDGVYPFCGLYAARPHTAINRVWRDLHTASQHPILLR